MRDIRFVMGMPAVLEIVDATAGDPIFEKVFAYLTSIDERFSTYKESSEVSRLNRGELSQDTCSEELKTILALAEGTKKATDGYFDAHTPDGSIDPSGIVKGWAIREAARMIAAAGYKNYYVEIAGDIQTSSMNAEGTRWSVGIRNPFNRDEIVKVIYPGEHGVATSGTSARGAHIYNPHSGTPAPADVVSITLIGPDVYEADRFATAAFAMGTHGVEFVETLPGFEAYAIDKQGIATFTSGFESYTSP